MTDCLFCKMVSRQISPQIVLENDFVLAFRDINPQAPTHVLVIPKQHIATLNDALPEHVRVLGELLLAAKQIAQQEGLSERGYRTVFNCNRDAGQTVFHVHMHVLGGRAMGWPPG